MDSPSQEPAPEEKTSTVSRKGILDFVQSLKKPARTETSQHPSAVIDKPLAPSGALYRHFSEFGWAAQQNIWLKVSLVVHLVLVALIWFGAYLAWSRPTYLQVGAPTLVQASKDFFGPDYERIDPSLLFDQISFFSVSALSQLYQIDPDGTNYVDLMQGMVNSDIIARSKKNFLKNKETIQAQKFIQNLVVQRIYPPIFNNQTGTFALFVEGYFSIALQDTQGSAVNRITPYRAKMVFRLTPTSTLNIYPFFFEELTDVFGVDDCKKWDTENKKFLKQ